MSAIPHWLFSSRLAVSWIHLSRYLERQLPQTDKTAIRSKGIDMEVLSNSKLKEFCQMVWISSFFYPTSIFLLDPRDNYLQAFKGPCSLK